MATEAAAEVAPARRRPRGGSAERLPSVAAIATASFVAAAIVGAGAAKVVDAPEPTQTLLRVTLAVAFVLLTLLDLRTAFEVVVLEVVVAGASGRWTEYGSGVSGRIVLESIFMAGVAVALARCALRRRPLPLGRYGIHALAVAVVLPAVWMVLGLARGNRLADVVGDGNGVFFLAFALAVSLLVAEGHGPAIRQWLFVACIANAVVTGVLVLVSATRWVELAPTLSHVLVDKLAAGNVVGYMPDGSYRLYLASALFFPIGIALAGYRLLKAPRSIWLWAVYALLWADLVATYTRGLWISAVVALAAILALGSPRLRTSLVVLAGTAALFGTATGIGYAAGWSLPDYVGQRTSSILRAAPSESQARRQVADGGFEQRGRWRAVGGVEPERTGDRPFAGRFSLRLAVDRPGRDRFVFQNVGARPESDYTVEARARAGRVTAAAADNRGFVVWDVSGGRLHNAPLARTPGWQRLRFVLHTGPRSRLLQIRLYAPQGVVDWDAVRIVPGRSAPGFAPAVARLAPQPAFVAEQMGSRDAAGAASNTVRREQARVLFRHIRHQPVVGYGYGAIAADYGYSDSYSYELSYLDILFKTGVLGLLLFLSVPLRLAFDALRARYGRVGRLPPRVSPYGTSIVLATIAVILIDTATNPVLVTSFGLLPIVLMIAWLDPVLPPDRREVSDSPRR